MTTAPTARPAPTPCESSVPLSRALREGSADAHAAAEGSAFMAALVDGSLGAAGYATYLARLRPVYATLERLGAEQADDRFVAAVHDVALARLARLDADLAFWSQRAGAAPAGGSPATDAYVARLEETRLWGGLYVAHHYTRYLGDLSGGQGIGRLMQGHHGLDRASGGGVAFYAFPQIERVKPYKDAYRARLDALPVTLAERERMVAEVRVAFDLNRWLLAELGSEVETAA
ncbi:biliverdin-producing heme oxygenase [Nocardioides sp. TRM66260-LWL]|uniref:biliverdin-producing heme oxygenase n=1 Tax=Nocardioides sp. TRM66260-LWL TaxID=2874478 RepID=UPI001CC69AED|nr:biliverdin-producing heme oxygenase [Nocardioides sp. TRM66260-LWL]MBZ5734474.1 biliverdin-producing heme oxygenase [Nocardioides sp. TRM66260-LWL]